MEDLVRGTAKPSVLLETRHLSSWEEYATVALKCQREALLDMTNNRPVNSSSTSPKKRLVPLRPNPEGELPFVTTSDRMDQMQRRSPKRLRPSHSDDPVQSKIASRENVSPNIRMNIEPCVRPKSTPPVSQPRAPREPLRGTSPTQEAISPVSDVRRERSTSSEVMTPDRALLLIGALFRGARVRMAIGTKEVQGYLKEIQFTNGLIADARRSSVSDNATAGSRPLLESLPTLVNTRRLWVHKVDELIANTKFSWRLLDAARSRKALICNTQQEQSKERLEQVDEPPKPRMLRRGEGQRRAARQRAQLMEKHASEPTVNDDPSPSLPPPKRVDLQPKQQSPPAENSSVPQSSTANTEAIQKPAALPTPPPPPPSAPDLDRFMLGNGTAKRRSRSHSRQLCSTSTLHHLVLDPLSAESLIGPFVTTQSDYERLMASLLVELE